MQPCVRGRVEVTKDIFDFSSTQDLRLRVGCDATASQDGNETLVQVVSTNMLAAWLAWSHDSLVLQLHLLIWQVQPHQSHVCSKASEW